AYGLAMALTATWWPVYSLGFQYALQVVPQAFAAALMCAAELPPAGRRQASLVAVGMSLLVCYHYGMIYPGGNFTGGFSPVDFTLTDTQRLRYQEVGAIARALPPDASVTASESLVPHVARRERVQTLRSALSGPARSYDYYFIVNEDLNASNRASFPEVFGGR